MKHCRVTYAGNSTRYHDLPVAFVKDLQKLLPDALVEVITPEQEVKREDRRTNR